MGSFTALGITVSISRRRASPRGSGTPGAEGDDFDWRTYSADYGQQRQDVGRTHLLRLSPGDYAYRDRVLTRENARLSLHPNHRLLYETLLQLDPTSVAEIGCGAGDHLSNLQLLAPNWNLHGLDRSPDQLRLLRRHSPELAASVGVADLTLPHSRDLPEVDVCYTQAVLMHIQTGHGHLVALSNMFRIARRQVVLMENWERHAFCDDMQQLHHGGMIPWDELYCYFRRAPELGDRPHLVIASCTPLDYELLADDRPLHP